jgi:hypothetical protein
VETTSELRRNGVENIDMVNPHFEPTPEEESVLSVLKQENRANPYLIRENTELGKGEVNTALTRLTSAGWVLKVTRGLYEYVDDPRKTDESDTEPSPREDKGSVDDALSGWSPGQGAGDTRQRVEIGHAVVKWLRQSGEKAQKGDFVEALYDDHRLDRQNPNSWWETTARRALQHAAERGYVDDSGKRYSWIGDTDD